MSDEQERRPIDPSRVELLSRAVLASRELCELLWEAMHEELRDPREERVRELAERLSEVASTVALLTLGPPDGRVRGERRTTPDPVRAEEAEDRPSHLASVPGGGPPAGGPMTPDPAPSGPAAAPLAPSSPVAPTSTGRAPGAAADPLARMRLVDEHPQAPTALPPSLRREEGAAAWVHTVGALLERHAVDGLPFAVLLVEVIDVAHIQRTESPVQVDNLTAQVEHALGRALRADDTLTRESLGRYWLVAPETNGTGARMLAERLARLVRGSASHRGVPLEVAIGIAVCPDDGTDAPALAARADLGVYSARANGQPVARTDPPA